MNNRASSPASRERFIAVSTLAAGLLLAATCLLRVALDQEWLHARWNYYPHWLWLASADLAAMVLIGVWGSPQGLRCWAAALAPHLLLLGGAVLLALQGFDAVALWSLELLTCIAIAAGWFLVLVGAVVLPVALAGRGTSVAPMVRRRWLRCWVAATAFLATAEAAVWLVEHATAAGPAASQLVLPVEYRDAPAAQRPVVALGGSTMLGFPYQPQIGIPEVLRELVQALQSDGPVALANLAERGINFRRAADRLTHVETRPRLLLLYTGHNEYFYDVPLVSEQPRRWPRRVCDRLLRWSGLYRWVTACIPQQIGPVSLGPDASIVRRPYMSAPRVQQRQEQFRTDLTAFAEHCHRHEIPTLWFLPAASEGIFLPNRSVTARELSTAEDREVNERFRHCRRLIDRGEYESAQASLLKLDVRFPRIAEIEFWIGVCLRELGQIEAAREWFRRAVDHDQKPACATSGYRDIIAEVAGKFEIEVIDAEVVLGDLSPTGLRDRHVIHDNVHPTLRAFCELAQAALKSRTIAEVFALEQPIPEQVLSFEEILRRREFTAADLARAYERMAFCYRTLARMRTDQSDRMACAMHYQQWADRLERCEIVPGEEGTEALTGEAVPGVRLE